MSTTSASYASSSDLTAHIVEVSTSEPDRLVAQVARISYDNDGRTTTATDDRRLLRRLMRHDHTSPFEHVTLRILVQCPLSIAAQWMRHRTWAYSQVSLRYRHFKGATYIPLYFRKDKDADSPPLQAEAERIYVQACQDAIEAYNSLIDMGVAREQARFVLPNGVMTRFYGTTSLHNLLHFLRLRMHPDAQGEIQELAYQLFMSLRQKAPMTADAFADYRLSSVTLTSPELDYLSGDNSDRLSKGERVELEGKVQRLKERGLSIYVEEEEGIKKEEGAKPLGEPG